MDWELRTKENLCWLQRTEHGYDYTATAQRGGFGVQIRGPRNSYSDCVIPIRDLAKLLRSAGWEVKEPTT